MERAWLVNLRSNAGMSQETVAHQSGITRQYYSMIESGDRNPGVDVAKAIAGVLDFKWTIFFDQESNETLLEPGKSTA